MSSAAEPEILYHYTPPNGLLGILSGKTVWATSIEHLNDATEFDYFRHIAIDSLQEVLKQRGLPSNPDEFTDVARVMSPSKFVFCLTEKGDLLSQWRGYGDLSGSFSIGFDVTALQQQLSALEPTFCKCKYLNEAALGRSDLIQNLCNTYADSLEIARSMAGESERATHIFSTMIDFLVGIGTNAHEYKHPGFEEESEWRIIASPMNVPTLKVKYRTTNIGLVPYVELPFDNLPIKEIVVGPGRHQDLAAQTAKELMESSGLKDVEILVSAIPFRTGK